MSAREQIVQALVVSAEVMGTTLSDTAAAVIAADLERYDPEAVLRALVRCRREVKGRLSLAAIIERIDDGRPTTAEAYAMLPWSEAESAVPSEEMLRAWGVCRHLLSTDRYAARQAFTAAYEREVTAARARGEPVKWALSLGHDPDGRALVLAEAVRRGKLTFEHAERMLSGAQRDAVGEMLPVDMKPTLPAPDPVGQARIRGLVADLRTLLRERKPKPAPIAGTAARDGIPDGPKAESAERVRQMMIDLERQQRERQAQREGAI